MIEIGLYLMAVGMGSVFLALSILALIMWLMGIIIGSPRDFEMSADMFSTAATFSKEELMAIAAAVLQYESASVPKVDKIPESWKKFAKFYSVGWSG